MASAAFDHSSGIMICGDGLSVSEAASILDDDFSICTSLLLSIFTLSFFFFSLKTFCLELCGGGEVLKVGVGSTWQPDTPAACAL